VSDRPSQPVAFLARPIINHKCSNPGPSARNITLPKMLGCIIHVSLLPNCMANLIVSRENVRLAFEIRSSPWKLHLFSGIIPEQRGIQIGQSSYRSSSQSALHYCLTNISNTREPQTRRINNTNFSTLVYFVRTTTSSIVRKRLLRTLKVPR
jgi:hypothetical protein